MKIPDIPGDLHFFNNFQYKPTLSLDFVRGVLNTLAFVNTDRNRYQSFDFDLIDVLLIDNDIVRAISCRFPEDNGYVQIKLVPSNEASFKDDLNKWLFYQPTNSDRFDDYMLFVEQFATIVTRIIQPTNYYRLLINEQSQWYRVGIEYDYHILTSEDKVYLFGFLFTT